LAGSYSDRNSKAPRFTLRSSTPSRLLKKSFCEALGV
jgi:hypothetical protein